MKWEACTLGDLLPSQLPDELAGLQVQGVAQDSREIAAGDLFVARSGLRHRGVDFIEQAAADGAVAAIIDADEHQPEQHWPIPVIPVANLAGQVGPIAARFYGNPSRQMRIVGITGTNGKTSCSHFIAQALETLGHRCAVIGTVGNGFIGQLHESKHTTPDAVGLQRLLAELRAEDAEVVVMEVSSHALEQYRVAGIEFDVALFTNLSRDHLDYHGSIDAYGAAKARLFTDYPLSGAAIWCDDAFGQRLHNQLAGADMTLLSVGETRADLRAEEIELSGQGISALLRTPWGNVHLRSQVVGRFNLTNLMLSAAALGLLEVGVTQIEQGLNAVLPVAGRMQRIGGGEQPLVVIDYAHTPDALQQALSALHGHLDGRLICVFGCGGDRDQGKRAQMAQVAEQWADLVVVTSDNPRTENPDAIIEMVLEGLVGDKPKLVEADRRIAIERAIAEARPGDIVLIAGKGHETYQEIDGQRYPFSDLEEAQRCLEGAADD
ncbi:UDP-N-acetylmuramoyl-L-alanyl-D-glutamate--2,6-diaminopimelate ligase [Marinobacterium arenosum]|uniref:UDP-N-acetylmuramoyl-L-alanyl-D-glutamate--2, 6-diaminopimelate ligase n=1 Tax=Marinobacterium arenosum TaxID=2862496 RepID=UPI001C9388F3|nr:UDP-N-acetylmuramoyl-L-alanyl-D-glutamate--2,6-diaminopimelate ligase [Marinobacterium arenosum]MBY4676603.1 UDP-N-acetylmuramoyl-L-alanyl-D-glutamate--2,6-diaminopimelate ligase [Marinobacterium arenosum]